MCFSTSAASASPSDISRIAACSTREIFLCGFLGATSPCWRFCSVIDVHPLAHNLCNPGRVFCNQAFECIQLSIIAVCSARQKQFILRRHGVAQGTATLDAVEPAITVVVGTVAT